MIGLTLLRIARSRAARGSLLAWTALSIAAAVLARHGTSSTGVLVTSFASLALPLATLSLVSAATCGANIRAAVRPVVELGGHPRFAALALTLTTCAVAAILLGALGAATAAIGHGATDPPPLRDALLTFGVGALGAIAYAALLAASSLVGRGALRALVLVVDFVLGSGSGLGAACMPRAHVRALLAGASVADLSARASSWVLVAIAVASLAAVVVVTRRA